MQVEDVRRGSDRPDLTGEQPEGDGQGDQQACQADGRFMPHGQGGSEQRDQDRQAQEDQRDIRDSQVGRFEIGEIGGRVIAQGEASTPADLAHGDLDPEPAHIGLNECLL